MVQNIIGDFRYNSTFDLDTLEDNNYVFSRCKTNFDFLYEHKLTKELYKSLVNYIRKEYDNLPVTEVNDFLVYIHFAYDGVTYKVKFNLIDQLIKSFDYLSKTICRQHDFPIDKKVYSAKPGLRELMVK